MHISWTVIKTNSVTFGFSVRLGFIPVFHSKESTIKENLYWFRESVKWHEVQKLSGVMCLCENQLRSTFWQRSTLTFEVEIAELTVGLPVSDSNLDSTLSSSEVSVAAHTLRRKREKWEKNQVLFKRNSADLWRGPFVSKLFHQIVRHPSTEQLSFVFGRKTHIVYKYLMSALCVCNSYGAWSCRGESTFTSTC